MQFRNVVAILPLISLLVFGPLNLHGLSHEDEEDHLECEQCELLLSENSTSFLTLDPIEVLPFHQFDIPEISGFYIAPDVFNLATVCRCNKAPPSSYPEFLFTFWFCINGLFPLTNFTVQWQ